MVDMQSIGAYIKSFSQRLIFKILVIFALITAVAGALLYVESLRFPFPETYGRAIAAISLYKLQILKNGIYIYALYALLVVIGVVIITWIYSSRAARPFKKIKEFAAQLLKGNFVLDIRLTNNGEAHPLEETIKKMASSYFEMQEKLRKNTEVLSQNTCALQDALRHRNETEFRKAYDSITATAEEMERTLSELKL